MRRHRPVLAVLILFVASCSLGSPVVGEGVEAAADTNIPSTTVIAGEVEAIVTPTGVVVAVTAQTASGYVVLTPCGREAAVATGTPVSDIAVVIDPGHGGEVDTGALGPNGLLESDLNLDVAQAVKTQLERRGVRTVLTRTGDYAVDLAVRTSLADRLGAEVLVSIHHNSPTLYSSTTPGTEVYVRSDSADSKRLGGLIYQEVVGALSSFEVEWSSAREPGVLVVLNSAGKDAYGIVRGPATVSVLTEVGYISHQPEAELFATEEYRETASVAIANAIESYLETDATGSGYVEEPRIFDAQPAVGGDNCQDPELQ